jgi:predicted Zn-dependent protease
MREHFLHLFDKAQAALTGAEVLLAGFDGESSDFVRLSGGKVRQPGRVEQGQLTLRLVRGARNARATLTVSGDRGLDEPRVASLIGTLREQLDAVPDDPYLLYATEVRSSDRQAPSRLTPAEDVTDRLVEQTRGLDFVGIYASGAIWRGFANSLGQRNWYETHSFNLDYSLYLRADKAVKGGYGGFAWDDAAFAAKIARGRDELTLLAREPKTIAPGRYHVYLAPRAVAEFIDMLAWGGLGLKAIKTRVTPLLKVVDGITRLSPLLTMREASHEGIAPDFDDAGFVKPPEVTLIERGRWRDPLVSSRSAKEYGAPTNGASETESPVSIAIDAGGLSLADVPARLGDGVYVNNLWYLNFSDRPAGRVTGMTRFATFWVEGGRIKQPLNVMRFDESLLRLFGDHLEDLTSEREMILSSSTYGHRATSSTHLPGLLVKDFAFTL